MRIDGVGGVIALGQPPRKLLERVIPRWMTPSLF
jgi:hypothetical protein